MLFLYSKRWSTAKGWFWKLERDTLPENAESWLSIFRKEEPEIEFVVSEKQPIIKRK